MSSVPDVVFLAGLACLGVATYLLFGVVGVLSWTGAWLIIYAFGLHAAQREAETDD